MLLTRRSLIILALAAVWQMLVSILPLLSAVFIIHVGLVIVLILVDFIFTPSRDDMLIERLCEDKLSLLDENTVTLTVHNRTDRPMAGAVVDEYPDPGSVNPEVLEFNLEPRASVNLTYRYRPEKRGDVVFPRVHVRVKGRLGFVIRRFIYPLSTSVQVYPNLIQTREFEIERSQPLSLFIDCGRQMIGRIGEHTRLDYAINAALMLAYVAILKGDQVGLIAFSSKIQHYIAPKRGAAQMNRIIEALYDVQPSEVESDYAGAIMKFLGTWRKRSLIVFFSDVVDPSASSVLLGHLPSLHPRHLPMAVLLKDPELAEIEAQVPAGASELYEKAVACDLATSRDLAVRQLRQAGCLTVDVAPQDLTVAVVNEYLRLKARSMI